MKQIFKGSSILLIITLFLFCVMVGFNSVAIEYTPLYEIVTGASVWLLLSLYPTMLVIIGSGVSMLSSNFTMKRTFRDSLILFSLMLFLFCIMASVGGIVGRRTPLYDLTESTAFWLVLFSLPVILVTIASGIGTLLNRSQDKGKHKQKNTNFGYNNDSRIEEIMQRLSPEQRVYLENQLQNSRLGVNTDDGELMPLNDLLEDSDSKEKR